MSTKLSGILAEEGLIKKQAAPIRIVPQATFRDVANAWLLQVSQKVGAMLHLQSSQSYIQGDGSVSLVETGNAVGTTTHIFVFRFNSTGILTITEQFQPISESNNDVLGAIPFRMYVEMDALDAARKIVQFIRPELAKTWGRLSDQEKQAGEVL